MQKKNANRVSIIVMNPKNGEIYAMVNAPEFSLNEPFELVTDRKTKIQKQKKTYPGRMKCSHTQHQRKINKLSSIRCGAIPV